ncbi:hypothetical protein BGX27_005436 [Mortierella sp. AM989]|nr:hypothetical protein BGX27_005436 [Mortierella sp. AM989]
MTNKTDIHSNNGNGATLVYLDIEIGDQTYKHESWDHYRRGQAFFATHGSLYGYEGKIISELGSEDIQNLQEIYDSNPSLVRGGVMTLTEPAPLPGGRLIFKLDDTGCPKTCQNFLNFIESTYTNKVQEATYVNTRLFRLVKDHIIQGGDFTKNDGSGGFSSFPSVENPKPFADERHGLRKGAFNKAGVLAMANRGKNTNGSQFFVTIGQGARWTKALEGSYVAFGEVVEEDDGSTSDNRSSNSSDICVDGFALLDKLNKIPTDEEERPILAITIIEHDQILQDFILFPKYLSDKEHDMLVEAATKKLKRALGRQVRYEDGHFDGVITRYRECSASDWGSEMELEAEAAPTTNVKDRTTPQEVMQSIKQQFFPTDWRWVAPHILELESGKGGIKPHVDHLDASGEVVAGLCLGSTAVMELIHQNDPKKQFRVLLPKGCFYFQRDSVRYHYKHGIPIQTDDHHFKGYVIPKEKRISIMLRNAIDKSIYGKASRV